MQTQSIADADAMDELLDREPLDIIADAMDHIAARHEFWTDGTPDAEAFHLLNLAAGILQAESSLANYGHNVAATYREAGK